MSCIFCKIISGEIPAKKIYEDDNFIAILDAFPSSAGHCLVIPKLHASDILEMEEALAGQAFEVAAKIAKKMKAALCCDGVNILQNNCDAAGQTVHHFHVHVIPRYINDNIIIKWKSAPLNDNEAERVKVKLVPSD